MQSPLGFGNQSAFSSTIMISIINATPLSDKKATKASLPEKSRAGSYILLALFAVTAMAGTHEVLRFQSSREWVTVSLPNPPAPLPDNSAPSFVQTGMLSRP
jgi:hypothetical protein